MAKKTRKTVATETVAAVETAVETPVVETAAAVETPAATVESQQTVLASMGIQDREEPKFMETATKKFNLSDALREVLTNDIDSTWEDAKLYLSEKYPLQEYNEKSGQSTLSTLRSKMKNNGEGNPRGTKSIVPSLNANDLRDVATFAKNNGGINKFLEMTELISDAANLVGGLAQLQKALKTIQEMAALIS